MKNILVPTDFSANAESALHYGLHVLSDEPCNFYILHVASLLASAEVTNPINETIIKVKSKSASKTKEQLTKTLEQTKKESIHKNHHFYALYDSGFIIETIKKYIEAYSIDLIIMGTKGASGLMEKVVGSTAGDVLTKVKCNTLVVPQEVEFKKPREIAFPTDFNIYYAHNILNAIYKVMALNDGQLRIMHVGKEGIQLNQEQIGNKSFLIDYLNESFEHRHSFHLLTNKSIQAAIQCFVESRDIDMIIMVAKNLNFIQQILFDSTVEKISFHTKVPFYVIHE
ncbi:MAG: universal stress protein [Croceitalea sp.]|nr:universal stress protein [Croceitalea sp.]